MRRLHLIGAAFFAWLVLATSAVDLRGDASPWAFREWKVRRIVTVDFEPTNFPGEDVAVAEFYTGGFAKPDGADIRICASGGRRAKFRILQAGPGDFMRIAFELVRGAKKYYIYYGNAEAEVAEETKNWQPQRGVLLEVRQWQANDAGSVEAVQKAFEESKELIGADFIDRVFLGHNPFGPSGMRAVYHFTGFFVPPQSGMYDVATSSDDASFLLVDGEQVIAWPGVHGRTHLAHFTNKCSLSHRRVHRLDYWLVDFGGEMTAVAAWRPPGAAKHERYDAIPAEAFLPIFRAQLHEVDIRAQGLVADFFAENAGESWFGTYYPVRMKFRNVSKGANPSYGSRAEWDFGDGQKSTEWEPEHIYLAPGTYTVKLAVLRGANRTEVSNRVYVNRDWRKQTQHQTDGIGAYARVVADYDFAKLDSKSLVMAINLFEHLNLSKESIEASHELVFKDERKDVPAEELFAKALLLGERLRQAKRFADAIAAYHKGESRVQSVAEKVGLVAEAGNVRLNDLNDPVKAEEEFSRALKNYSQARGSPQMRRVLIGLADAYRRRGDYEKAKENYVRADKIRGFSRSKEQNAARVGILARYVEHYTRTRDFYWAFHFLDTWAWEYPQQKLEGYWSLLRSRALMANGDFRAALREVLDLTATNPDSPHAVELLLLSADCYLKLDDKPAAVKVLENIAKNYPEDPRHREAVLRLKALSGEPPAPKENKTKPDATFFGI